MKAVISTFHPCISMIKAQCKGSVEKHEDGIWMHPPIDNNYIARDIMDEARGTKIHSSIERLTTNERGAQEATGTRYWLIT